MANFEAVERPDGTAIIVDTRSPQNSAHGREAATCHDISTAVELASLLNT